MPPTPALLPPDAGAESAPHPLPRTRAPRSRRSAVAAPSASPGTVRERSRRRGASTSPGAKRARLARTRKAQTTARGSPRRACPSASTRSSRTRCRASSDSTSPCRRRCSSCGRRAPTSPPPTAARPRGTSFRAAAAVPRGARAAACHAAALAAVGVGVRRPRHVVRRLGAAAAPLAQPAPPAAILQGEPVVDTHRRRRARALLASAGAEAPVWRGAYTPDEHFPRRRDARSSSSLTVRHPPRAPPRSPATHTSTTATESAQSLSSARRRRAPPLTPRGSSSQPPMPLLAGQWSTPAPHERREADADAPREPPGVRGRPESPRPREGPRASASAVPPATELAPRSGDAPRRRARAQAGGFFFARNGRARVRPDARGGGAPRRGDGALTTVHPALHGQAKPCSQGRPRGKRRAALPAKCRTSGEGETGRQRASSWHVGAG